MTEQIRGSVKVRNSPRGWYSLGLPAWDPRDPTVVDAQYGILAASVLGLIIYMVAAGVLWGIAVSAFRKQHDGKSLGKP